MGSMNYKEPGNDQRAASDLQQEVTKVSRSQHSSSKNLPLMRCESVAARQPTRRK